MAPTTSFFLDLLRTIAALIVFAVHCLFFWNGRYLVLAAHIAHSAVIVFFVLSGYVIAYSTLGKAHGVRGYAVARLSRLYSVLVPALVLTAVLQTGGHALNPDFAQFQSHGYETLRYLAVAVHLQSVWTFSASPLANGPLWSLSYEFWYYALFGAAVLLPSSRARTLGVVGVLLIAGPDILLLLPCWLAGVAVYLCRERFRIDTVLARAGFAASLAGLGVALVFLREIPLLLGYAPFWFSNMFLSDWALAFDMAAMILFFDAAKFAVPPAPVCAAVRWGAGHTFSLYLFHFPILAFITAVWRLDRPAAWQVALAAGGTLLAVLVLSTFTEAKRDVWRRGFSRLWDAGVRPSRV